MFSKPSPTSRRELAKKPSPEEMARNLNVGIVLHDNQNTMAEGWAIMVGRPSVRVRGLFDLPNDALWISSGDFNDFRKLGGAQFHHVRRTGYLGLKLAEIAKDFGIRIDGGHAKDGGEKIVGFVQETVRLAVELYRLDNPLRQLQEDTLVSTIAKALPPAPPSTEVMTAKLSSAYQSWSSKFVPFMDNTVSIRLRFARVPYAHWLLSNEVPDSGWSHVLSNNGFDGEAVMRGDFPPTLIEAVLEFDSVDPVVAELIAYGVGGQANQRSKRSWMTDVEYRWVSTFARVHVQSYFMAVNLMPLPASYQLPDLIGSEAVLSQQASIGLLSYMHWQALVASKYSRITGRSEHDLYGTWIRAHDRAKCFEAAYVLQQRGFNVSGYGNGSVLVRADRGKIEELADAAMDLDLVYPNWNGLLKEFGYEGPYVAN